MYVASTGQTLQPSDNKRLWLVIAAVVGIGGITLANRQLQRSTKKRKLSKKEQRVQNRVLLAITVAGPLIYYGFMQR